MLGAAVAASGCSSHASTFEARTLASFPDAERRFGNSSGTDFRATYKFPIGDATYNFKVKAMYRSVGAFSFVLADPQNDAVKRDTLQEPRDVDAGPWYDSSGQALKGTWRIDVNLERGGTYMFGVYYVKG